MLKRKQQKQCYKHVLAVALIGQCDTNRCPTCTITLGSSNFLIGLGVDGPCHYNCTSGDYVFSLNSEPILNAMTECEFFGLVWIFT